MIPILLLVTASFQPPKPTVGDLITVRFEKPVTLDRSQKYEIVSQHGNTVVIRTFHPAPFTISGRTGDVVFRNMTVPVHSVLKPNDKLDSAPLKPPRSEPYPRMPFVAIAVAAVAALAAWIAAAMRRDRSVAQTPSISPADQFRKTVAMLRRDPNAARRWARLADALREYLAATSYISPDLTTTEILEQLGGGQPPPAVVRDVLHQGDLEKFSPWGPLPADFDEVAQRALETAA
jgi:hypothetical protein